MSVSSKPGERKMLLTRAPKTASRRAVSANDVAKLAMLPLWFAMAWIVPYRAWPAATRFLVMLRILLGFGRPVRNADRIASILPEGLHGRTPRQIWLDGEASRYEHYFQVFRDYRPGGWNEPLEIIGADRLRQAKEDGSGAILWVAHFVFNGLAPKKGLHDAGFPYVHLSRPEHGFSKTRFGIRVLNPLRRKVEDRYLAGRAIIRQNSGIGAMRDLRKTLADNGIVSVTAGSWEGRVIVEPEVFGRRMPLATGPIALAIATGAPLFPVFVWRDPRTGSLTVEIDTEIPVGGSGDKSAVVAAAANTYAARLQERIHAAPEQWRGWRYLERK